MGDLIDREAEIDAVGNMLRRKFGIGGDLAEITLAILPTAQPEIIMCKDCKYWTQSVGKMKGYGLGRCDFHDANLVACNGFCYWAERREE